MRQGIYSSIAFRKSLGAVAQSSQGHVTFADLEAMLIKSIAELGNEPVALQRIAVPQQAFECLREYSRKDSPDETHTLLIHSDMAVHISSY
jgi:hypothetical protein